MDYKPIIIIIYKNVRLCSTFRLNISGLKYTTQLVIVEPITNVIRSGRLRWNGHVMSKGDEDWVKKCMEFRVEGRRPVGRQKTWLESEEADMAKLEIDNEGHRLSCPLTIMPPIYYTERVGIGVG